MDLFCTLAIERVKLDPEEDIGSDSVHLEKESMNVGVSRSFHAYIPCIQPCFH